MRRVILVLMFLFAEWALAQVPGQQRARLNVGVLEFDARAPITKEEAASLSDIFFGQLVRSNEFVVVDRNRIKAILEEQGFQQSEACTQVECIVEVGRILKVQKMFAGVIGKVGRVFNVSIQVIDIATAQIQYIESKQHEGEIEDLVYEIVPEMAADMMSQMTGRRIEPQVTSSGSKWLWYVGGAVVLGGGAAALLLLKPKETVTPTNPDLPGPPGLPSN